MQKKIFADAFSAGENSDLDRRRKSKQGPDGGRKDVSGGTERRYPQAPINVGPGTTLD